MCKKQLNVDEAAKDYGYLEYFRKSLLSDNVSDHRKESTLLAIKFHESKRDYYTTSLRQVNHLVQIDEKPNLELVETKWELYKMSISFQPTREFKIDFDL